MWSSGDEREVLRRSSKQPRFHGSRNEIRSVLLDEMAGAGDGDQSQVFAHPVPGVVEGAGEESGVAQAVEHQDRHLSFYDGRGVLDVGLARVVALVVVE